MPKNITLGIREYDVPENLCNKIKDRLIKSDIFDWTTSGIGGNQINTQVRSSKDYKLDHEDRTIRKIKNFIYECTDEYAAEYLTNYTKNIDMSILKYQSGGHYLYHHDADYKFYRTISILLYLNPEEYEGGETHFKFFDLKVKPKTSKLVIFPSNFIYNHAALPVTKGEKYVIVGWMNDAPKEV